MRSTIRQCMLVKRLVSTQAAAATATSPHPALVYLPRFLSELEQRVLLSHSLRVLSSPSQAHMTSLARKKARTYRAAHPETAESSLFLADEAYIFESSHFDQVIQGFRECVVRQNGWTKDGGAESAATGGEISGEWSVLAKALGRLYSLIKPDRLDIAPLPSTDPPSHLQLHLLHLSSTGAIHPHVDNLDVSGGTIVGVSLGGERIMRFKKVPRPDLVGEHREEWDQAVDAFDVVLEPGSVYIQTEPLRSHYTHEIPAVATFQGRTVGGSQRLSLMLRDQIVSKPAS